MPSGKFPSTDAFVNYYIGIFVCILLALLTTIGIVALVHLQEYIQNDRTVINATRSEILTVVVASFIVAVAIEIGSISYCHRRNFK